MEKRILVIEDEADIREAMVEALTEAGYPTVGMENGAVGLAYALEHHPDLILLDLIMPVMGGQEMLDKLRIDEWGRHARVVIMTAMDDVTNVATAHRNDIADYIIKAHTSLDEVVNKVREALYTS
jgi:CheY-like chemotaxis protein